VSGPGEGSIVDRRLLTVGSAFAAAVVPGTGPAVARSVVAAGRRRAARGGAVHGGHRPVRRRPVHGRAARRRPVGHTYSFALDGAVGRSVITTRTGQLLGEDQGQLDWTSATTATFTTTVDIVGGTQRYRQADGVVVASGTLDLQRSPQMVGVYTGTIEIVPGSAANCRDRATRPIHDGGAAGTAAGPVTRPAGWHPGRTP
jgi:hypothetical protein